MHSITRAVAGMGAPHSPGKITVDEYYEMARVGMIDPDARVELIEGEIVAMAPIGLADANINLEKLVEPS